MHTRTCQLNLRETKVSTRSQGQAEWPNNPTVSGIHRGAGDLLHWAMGPESVVGFETRACVMNRPGSCPRGNYAGSGEARGGHTCNVLDCQ